MQGVTETQILDALHHLEPHLWGDVLDFIAFLTHQATLERAPSRTQPLTATDVLQSELVELWADRTDMGDSVTFTRQLRQQAEHRRSQADDRR